MNIFALKDALFCDLPDPMGFRKHKGFYNDEEITSARAFGDTVYFYSSSGEWCTTTPECTVVAASLNDFKGEEHYCRLHVTNEWSKATKISLQKAARLAFDQGLLKRAILQYPTFETFWEHCTVPKDIVCLSTFAWTKRGRKKQFINMYNGKQEITGTVALTKGSVVKVPIRWTLSESGEEGRVEFGFRAQFSAGLTLVKLGGNPPTIKRPWSWSAVDFITLSVPLYDSFVIRTPCMEITDSDGSYIRVNLDDKMLFKEAMASFHNQAEVEEWDGVIYLKKLKHAPVGHLASASIVAVRNNTHIEWHAEKLLVVPRKQVAGPVAGPVAGTVAGTVAVEVAGEVGRKRDADSMDSSSFGETKRLCTSNDSNVHMKA